MRDPISRSGSIARLVTHGEPTGSWWMAPGPGGPSSLFVIVIGSGWKRAENDERRRRIHVRALLRARPLGDPGEVPPRVALFDPPPRRNRARRGRGRGWGRRVDFVDDAADGGATRGAGRGRGAGARRGGVSRARDRRRGGGSARRRRAHPGQLREAGATIRCNDTDAPLNLASRRRSIDPR